MVKTSGVKPSQAELCFNFHPTSPNTEYIPSNNASKDKNDSLASSSPRDSTCLIGTEWLQCQPGSVSKAAVPSKWPGQQAEFELGLLGGGCAECSKASLGHTVHHERGLTMDYLQNGWEQDSCGILKLPVKEEQLRNWLAWSSNNSLYPEGAALGMRMCEPGPKQT